jgi:hypothetical protein
VSFFSRGEKAREMDFLTQLIQVTVANLSGSKCDEVVIFCCRKQNTELKNLRQKKCLN